MSTACSISTARGCRSSQAQKSASEVSSPHSQKSTTSRSKLGNWNLRATVPTVPTDSDPARNGQQGYSSFEGHHSGHLSGSLLRQFRRQRSNDLSRSYSSRLISRSSKSAFALPVLCAASASTPGALWLVA